MPPKATSTKLTVQELRAKAKSQGVKGFSKMRSEELKAVVKVEEPAQAPAQEAPAAPASQEAPAPAAPAEKPKRAIHSSEPKEWKPNAWVTHLAKTRLAHPDLKITSPEFIKIAKETYDKASGKKERDA